MYTYNKIKETNCVKIYEFSQDFPLTSFKWNDIYECSTLSGKKLCA